MRGYQKIVTDLSVIGCLAESNLVRCRETHKPRGRIYERSFLFGCRDDLKLAAKVAAEALELVERALRAYNK